MAIYSLNLKSIGRTTHAAGTAGAHLLYIARPDAQAELTSEHMPIDPNTARAWMNRAEMSDRKNARVADKVRLALPRELTPEQRLRLVQDFAQELTGGRVAWFAGIHAQGKDALNPHCHMVIRDRDIETGKRVLRLSDSPRDRAKAGLEPKAVDWVRAKWEEHANRALEAAGHDARIDRRTLEAQGIDRAPTIHIGPQAAHVDQFVDRPESKIKQTGNGRVIDYPQIDAGRTRKERHDEIIDLNIEKAARSKSFRVRETAKVQHEQARLDRQLENSLIGEARRRTRQQRVARAAYRDKLKPIRESRKADEASMRDVFRNEWTRRREAITERHQAERAALKAKQGRIGARVMRTIDFTGRTKRRQGNEELALQDSQKQERADMVAEYREFKQERQEALKQRYVSVQRKARANHAPRLEQLAVQRREAEREADRQRQMRAAEREQIERQSEERIRRAEQLARSQMMKGARRNIGPTLG